MAPLQGLVDGKGTMGVYGHILRLFGYMPRGPNVAISLCIVSNARLDLSYFCMAIFYRVLCTEKNAWGQFGPAGVRVYVGEYITR